MKLAPSDKYGALVAGSIDDITPEEKQLALLQVGGKLVDRVLDAHAAEGVEMSPLHTLYMHEQLRVFHESTLVEKRLRELRALERNITKLVHEHHAWRHARNGNVIWEFCGPTGSGKSSSMLGLLERHNRVKPEDLAKHLTIDLPELPYLLPSLPNGSGVAVDEQTHAVGEGSVTQGRILRNMEDQIRLSGIDIYWASPEAQDHATSQGQFVAISTHFEKHYTRFLVYLNDIPLGYANLPWCSPAMWAAYQPLKTRNVERALRASFQATAVQDEHVRRLFENAAVQAACQVRRLKTSDWKRLIKRHATTLNTSQIQGLAEEIEFMLETIAVRPDDFRTIYGWDPTPEMVDAAGGAPSTRRRNQP